MAGMRLLVLGGTAWFSRAVAAHAIERGHEVVCAARGDSGSAAAGTHLVRVDRDEPHALSRLAGEDWDSVVDVARRPSHARSAVATLGRSTNHWLYVSTVSVYADHRTPGQTEDAPTLAPAGSDVDESDMKWYGELKRACEVAVAEALPDRFLLLRPGLIVGPGDPSGRFAYWPHHALRARDLLVPGSPEDSIQLVDVRDLASWTVRLAEQQVTGVLNGIGPAMPRDAFVESVIGGVGSRPRRTWVSDNFLVEQDVQPWAGHRSIPLWIADEEWAGFMAHDVSAAIAAGLQLRPLADTARDTSAWMHETPEAEITGLTDVEHDEVLAAWHARAV
jgi:2'-hydroxyisoflavone reductase